MVQFREGIMREAAIIIYDEEGFFGGVGTKHML